MSQTPLLRRLIRCAFGAGALGLAAVPLAHAQTLVSYYSFDAGTIGTSGSNITSASGTGNTLTPLGTAPTVNSSGRFGGAANFSGASGLDTPTFGTGATSLGNSFSISVWINTPDVTASSNSYLFQIGATSGEAQNAILFGYSAGTAELYASSLGHTGTNPRPISGITLNSGLNNTWFNIVYTYDGTTLRGFLNGVEAFSTTASFSMTAAGGLSVGSARNGAASVPGSLDDFAIFSGALSQSQITALQSGPAPSAVPEPSTYAAIAGGFALGFALWRRRRAPQATR